LSSPRRWGRWRGAGSERAGDARSAPRPVTEKDFAATNFSARSTTVDNRFLPLVPGQQFTLTGTTTAGKHEVCSPSPT